VDLTCRLATETTAEEVNQALRQAAEGPLKGILTVTEVPLVSVDYTSNPYSSIVDAPLTQVIDRRLAKVLAWYDNEMGFACRMVDLAAYMAQSM
jgi:glyceraldehyde 3-phosphate dehydrogenase